MGDDQQNLKMVKFALADDVQRWNEIRISTDLDEMVGIVLLCVIEHNNRDIPDSTIFAIPRRFTH